MTDTIADSKSDSVLSTGREPTLRGLFRSTADQLLRFVPMRSFDALVPRDLIGFCYHTVSDRPMPHLHFLYRCKTIEQFKRDLAFLHQRYSVIAYPDLSTRPARTKGQRPDVLLTFDDGFAECHDVIRPLLLQYGTPATFFLTTEFLDNRRLFYRHKVALCVEAYSRLPFGAATAARRDIAKFFYTALPTTAKMLARLRSATLTEEPAIDATCDLLGVDVASYLRTVRPYLTTAQVRTLAADGFTIGAHGTAHAPLGTMDESAAAADILASCVAISTLVPNSVVPFAFPFNGSGVRRQMLRALREAHPHIGLFFDTRSLAHDLNFVVNRLVVDDPRIGMTHGTNLPAYLRRAYVRELARTLTHRNARD